MSTTNIQQELQAEAAKAWIFRDRKGPKKAKANKSPKPWPVWFAEKALAKGVHGVEAEELRETIQRALTQQYKRKREAYDGYDVESIQLLEGDKILLDRFFRYAQPCKGASLIPLIITGPGKKVARLPEDHKGSVVRQLQSVKVHVKNGVLSAWSACTKAYKTLRKRAREEKRADFLTGTSVEETEGGVTLKFLAEDKYMSLVLDRIYTDDDYNCHRVTILSDNPDEFAFHHTDDSRIFEGETPAFDRWGHVFANDDARQTFMAWIWSVCDPHNTSRQALYLYDADGFTGKSVFVKALSEFWEDGSLANFTSALRHNSGSTNFDAASLYGSRLITYADCRSANILKTELMHSILGGDNMPIEGKHQAIFTGSIDAKVLVASNLTPNVNMEFINESSRLIFLVLSHPSEEYMRDYCKPDPDNPKKILRRSDGKPILVGSDLKSKLREEMPHILYRCREAYDKLCPSGAMIEYPDSVYDNQLAVLGDDTGDYFTEILRGYAVSDSSDFVPRFEILTDLKEQMKEFGVSTNTYNVKDFFRMFEAKFRVKPCKRGPRNSQIPGYVGVAQVTQTTNHVGGVKAAAKKAEKEMENE